MAWGTTAPWTRSTRHRQAEQGTHAWVRTAAVAAFFNDVSAFSETPLVLTAHDDKHDNSAPSALLSHAARAAGRRERVKPGGRQPVSGLGNHCRAPSPQVTRHRQAEQGTHVWVRTAAVVALIVAVSALAETPPVLTARGVHQHETQCALALLSHAARAAGRRERVQPGAGSQSVAWVATAARRGRRPRDRQAEQGTHA